MLPIKPIFSSEDIHFNNFSAELIEPADSEDVVFYLDKELPATLFTLEDGSTKIPPRGMPFGVPLTLIHPDIEGTEIIYATGSDEGCIVVRAREGTEARSWPAGTIAECRLTAQTLAMLTGNADASILIGRRARAITIGTSSRGCIVIGHDAELANYSSNWQGREPALADRAVVIGGRAKCASGWNTVAIGNGVSIGQREAPDAPEPLPMQDVIAIGSAAKVISGSDGAVVIGGSAGFYDRGAKRYVSAPWSVALGHRALVQAINTVAIGCDAFAKEDGGIAFGRRARSEGGKAVVIGRFARAEGEDGIAIGPDALQSGLGSVGIGARSQAKSTGSLALGYGAKALEHGSVVIGGGSGPSVPGSYHAHALPVMPVDLGSPSDVPDELAGTIPSVARRSTNLVAIQLPLLDLATQGDVVGVEMPQNTILLIDSIDFVITNADAVSGNPAIKVGISESEDDTLLASTEISATGLHERSTFAPAHPHGVTGVKVAVTEAASGTLKGKLIVRGYVMEV